MEKKVVVTAVVGMMMVSNMAFAGFGLPSLGGALGGDKKTESKEAAKPLDLTDVTNKQNALLQTMNAAMVLAGMAHTEIGQALGQTDSDMIATTNIMKKNNLAGDKKNADKVKKQLKNYTPQQFDAIAVNGTDAQKAALKSAMEKASTYKNASNFLFVAALAQAPGVLKEASGMLKGANLSQMGQLNGIVSTCNQVGGLNSATQKYFAAYSKNSANARALLKPNEAKPSDSNLKSMAQSAKEGNFNF